jgi:glycosyltransferase involved in cell wall biosynthesis
MDKAAKSLLATAIEEARVIPNGVDTTVFRPGDKALERSRLGLPADARILLCAGSMARADQWTDQSFLHSTLQYLRERTVECTFVFLGSAQSSDESVGGIRVMHRPYERDTGTVASYYRASDVYLHPARADTFPTTVLESLACGVPVVATNIGGIPEQVRSIWGERTSVSPPDVANGILVQAQDTTGAGRAVELILHQDDLRTHLGNNAAQAAASEFPITRQAERNLDWYQEILNRPRWNARSIVGKTTRKPGRPR